MNYSVVSPNAWNDGKWEKYLTYMKTYSVVFMGWGSETRYGKIFKNIAVGDCIIVARGANWQKKSYFTGIVDTPAMKDEISNYYFSQYHYCPLNFLSGQ